MLTLPRGAPTTPLYVYLAYHAGPRSVNHFYCTAPLFMHPSFFISADVFPQKVLTAGPSYANISPALSVFCVPPICASVQVPPRAPNQYNPNLFPIGNGFGLFVFFDCYETTHFRNGVKRRPTSKPRCPRKSKTTL